MVHRDSLLKPVAELLFRDEEKITTYFLSSKNLTKQDHKMDGNRVTSINEVNAWITRSKRNLSSLTKSSIGSLLALFSVL